MPGIEAYVAVAAGAAEQTGPREAAQPDRHAWQVRTPSQRCRLLWIGTARTGSSACRLDSEGKRYGKTLDWRVSEQRFEVRRDFCVLRCCRPVCDLHAWQELLEGLCKFADHYRLANDSWVDTRQSAAGSLPEVPRAQRQAEQRALLSHCSLLIEQHEDDLVAGLQRKSAPPVQQLLCQELSRACRPATSAETEL